MSNGLIKKTGHRLEEAAKSAAKRAVFEQGEYIRSVGKQLTTTKEEKSQGPSLIEEILSQSSGPQVSTDEEKKLESQKRKRLKEIEEELKSLRQKRETKEGEWEEEQSAALSSKEKGGVDKPLIIPTSRPSRGMMGGQKQTKGTGEMIKSPK